MSVNFNLLDTSAFIKSCSSPGECVCAKEEKLLGVPSLSLLEVLPQSMSLPLASTPDHIYPPVPIMELPQLLEGTWPKRMFSPYIQTLLASILSSPPLPPDHLLSRSEVCKPLCEGSCSKYCRPRGLSGPCHG